MWPNRSDAVPDAHTIAMFDTPRGWTAEAAPARMSSDHDNRNRHPG
jgi:hypothetical protein